MVRRLREPGPPRPGSCSAGGGAAGRPLLAGAAACSRLADLPVAGSVPVAGSGVALVPSHSVISSSATRRSLGLCSGWMAGVIRAAESGLTARSACSGCCDLAATAGGGLTVRSGLTLCSGSATDAGSAVCLRFPLIPLTAGTVAPLRAGPAAGASRRAPGVRSCSWWVPSERSAWTAARMRCRSSSESTGTTARRGRPRPGRAPDALRQFPAGLLVCHAGQTPWRYAYRAIRAARYSAAQDERLFKRDYEM